MSSIVKGLFGGKSDSEKILQRFTPAGFSSGGLSGSFNKGSNSFGVNRTAEGNSAVSNLVAGFENRRAEFADIRKDVKPGFGRLTDTRVDAIRRAGSRTVGNLREELGKRRVAGSSFAQREIAGVEAQFGAIEDQTRAEAFIQELGATVELIGLETQAAIEGASAVLSQLNFETGIATQLSAAASAQMNANITAQAEARAAQEGGAGAFLGTVIGAVAGGPIGAAIGKKIGGGSIKGAGSKN